MQPIHMAEHCHFVYSPDMELLLFAVAILEGENSQELGQVLCAKKRLAELQGKYRFLFEVFETHRKYAPMGALEPLAEFPLEDFTLEGYREFVFQMPPERFLQLYLMLGTTPLDEIRAAMEGDEALEALYRQHPQISGSLIGLQTFFQCTGRFLEEFFSLAEELRTEELLRALEDCASEIAEAGEAVRKSLEVLPPLDYSEKIMGKTFYDRGPFQELYFSVSLLISYRAVRFHGRNQFVVCSLRKRPPKDKDIIAQLKVIADPTRFQILTLLNQQQPLRGMDIAKALHIAASTVSHHMEQLRKVGVVNEEPVKNARYYSIDQNKVEAILARLSLIFGK